MKPLHRFAPFYKIGLLVLAWAVILSAFQAAVLMRFKPEQPDRVLNWTAAFTKIGVPRGTPGLSDLFLDPHAAWDSTAYLSIAQNGYDDPARLTVSSAGRQVSSNYAFFPVYPLTVRFFSWPLRLAGLAPGISVQIAGVLLSLLGAWMGCTALYFLLRRHEGPETARRAVFYVLIYPAGFFLAQIYSEGLFFGLALLALVLLSEEKTGLAALAALFASGTRPIGMALAIPFAITLLPPVWERLRAERKLIWKDIQRAALVAAPLVFPAGLLLSPWGSNFRFVDEHYFGRTALAIGASINQWRAVLSGLSIEQPETLVYYALEISAILLSLGACLALFKRYPGLALFSAACVLIPLTSGMPGLFMPQSFLRYTLHAYVVFIALARWGRAWWFDRLWTLVSLLLMALLLILFTFNFWVG